MAQLKREGGDISAADMIVNEEESRIVQFYSNSTIFLTGATGFLGKVLLEKILRTCHDIKKIYVLVRQKKDKDQQTRFKEIFDDVSFDNVKRNFPSALNKVILMIGDCVLPDLGLSFEDQAKLIAEVNVIFHCAATVRFDQKLKTAAYINVRAVRDLMIIAEQMKNLKTFLYVSTAYSNCVNNKIIKEMIYDAPISSEKLLELVEVLDDDKLEAITPIILGEIPNTYIYTKKVAENLIGRKGSQLPIGIIRPSIVIGSVKEPLAGWIDNFYGATGIFTGAALGVIRSLHCNKKNIADMVPADYVVNCGVAAAWEIAQKKKDIANEVPIYNFVSCQEAPITWGEYMSLGEKHCPSVPSPHMVWNYCFELRTCKYHHLIAHFFLHLIPAYLIDFALICMRKQPQMLNHYKRVSVFLNVIGYFSTKEWDFRNDNVQNLWKRMTGSDKESFEFSMKNFNWDSYFFTYVRGIRVYLLKDPLETIPQGRVKYYKLKIAHYALIALFYYCVYKLLAVLFFKYYGY